MLGVVGAPRGPTPHPRVAQSCFLLPTPVLQPDGFHSSAGNVTSPHTGRLGESDLGSLCTCCVLCTSPSDQGCSVGLSLVSRMTVVVESPALLCRLPLGLADSPFALLGASRRVPQ